MGEKLPWQRFYRTAESAGYIVELPGVRDRLDFRAKLRKYMDLDSKTNRIRPVYINGKKGEERSAFFARWHANSLERKAEEAEIRRMMYDACVGGENLAVNFVHHKGRSGLDQQIDIAFTSGFYQVDLPLFPYDEDRLVATFLHKSGADTAL